MDVQGSRLHTTERMLPWVTMQGNKMYYYFVLLVGILNLALLFGGVWHTPAGYTLLTTVGRARSCAHP